MAQKSDLAKAKKFLAEYQELASKHGIYIKENRDAMVLVDSIGNMLADNGSFNPEDCKYSFQYTELLET